MIIYFVDDRINIVYNKRVINIKFKNVSKGSIINRNGFMDEFLGVLKKEKIKGKLFGDNVTIVRNSYFNIRDEYFLENTFLEMGFLSVRFINIEENFSDDKNVYVEVNNSYIVIKGIYLDLDYFKDISKVLSYFAGETNKNVVLFGVNKNIPNIKINGLNVYYFENYDSFIVDNLLKVNEYGV